MLLTKNLLAVAGDGPDSRAGERGEGGWWSTTRASRPEKERSSVGGSSAVLGYARPGGQLPGAGHRALRGPDLRLAGGGRIYLPEAWAEDTERRKKAHVPAEVEFQTNGAIALDLIDRGRDAGIAPRAVVADPGYGDESAVLDGLKARGLPYLVGVQATDGFRLAEEMAADAGDGPPPAVFGPEEPPEGADPGGPD